MVAPGSLIKKQSVTSEQTVGSIFLACCHVIAIVTQPTDMKEAASGPGIVKQRAGLNLCRVVSRVGHIQRDTLEKRQVYHRWNHSGETFFRSLCPTLMLLRERSRADVKSSHIAVLHLRGNKSAISNRTEGWNHILRFVLCFTRFHQVLGWSSCLALSNQQACGGTYCFTEHLPRLRFPPYGFLATDSPRFRLSVPLSPAKPC